MHRVCPELRRKNGEGMAGKRRGQDLRGHQAHTSRPHQGGGVQEQRCDEDRGQLRTRHTRVSSDSGNMVVPSVRGPRGGGGRKGISQAPERCVPGGGGDKRRTPEQSSKKESGTLGKKRGIYWGKKRVSTGG